MGEAKRRRQLDPTYGKLPKRKEARTNTIVQTAMTKNLLDPAEVLGSEVVSVHMMVSSHPDFFNRAFCQIRTKKETITLWSDQPFIKLGSILTDNREWKGTFNIQVINGFTSKISREFSMKNASVEENEKVRWLTKSPLPNRLDYVSIGGLLSVRVLQDLPPEKINLQTPSVELSTKKILENQALPSPDYEQLTDLYLSAGSVPLQEAVLNWLREHNLPYTSDEDDFDHLDQVVTTVLDIASKKFKTLDSRDPKLANFELKVPFEPLDYSSYRPVQSNLALAKEAMTLINSGFFDNAINELINFEQDSIRTLRRHGLVLYMGVNGNYEIFDTACALVNWKPFQVTHYVGENRNGLDTIIESTFRPLSAEIQDFRVRVKRADKFPCLTLLCIVENTSTGDICEFRRHFTAQSGNQLTIPEFSKGSDEVAIVLSHVAAQLSERLAQDGIDPSQPAMAGELSETLQEIDQIRDLRGMARRAHLCERALELVTRNGDSKLWSVLQAELGTSLVQSPMGNRAENLERAIAAYGQSLEVRTREALPVEWAQSMMNLASAYFNRIRGDRGENIERAIIAYKQSLEVRTRAALPVDWATSMMNLALAYSEHIRGDRAENIERAIMAYEQSLEVRTRKALPVEWAESMMNLASAYFERIRGDRADNIERAITAYEQSLEVRTREALPVDWADSMNNLAIVYSERIRGDRGENIEKAITAYEQSLEVRTREALPVDWATSMMNLAIAYSERIRGDRADNIERAITAYEQSLIVITHEALPMDWAQLTMNLATAYKDRIRGDRADNIERAITAYEQSLEVLTREVLPVAWATSMNNLAIAYSDRIRGDRADNIERAITAYEQSLEVRTREALPVDWATSMMNLANAYYFRIQGDRGENVERAITAYEQSLEVLTREAIPVAWATSMMNLANAYYFRIQGDRGENIEKAITAYKQSLEIYTPETHPNHCRRVARLLANLYAEQSRWPEAKATYTTALTAAEILYSAALSKGSQEAELSETDDLYRRAAYAYAKVGDLRTAVATLEQGRARSLSETLQRDQANLDAIGEINPDLVQRYRVAAATIRQLESTERYASLDNSLPQYSQADFRQQITQARQALQGCITKIRQIPSYETFLALPTFNEVAAIAQVGNPLVYLLSTPNGSLALVLTTTGIPAALWLGNLTDAQLTSLLGNTWFGAYGQSQTNHQAWFKAIDQVTLQLWDALLSPLIAHLKKHGLSQATLIPTGYLSFLPLHAAWTPNSRKLTGRRYACDEIQFTYTPNALSLKAARAVADTTPALNLLAINEPQPVSANALPSSRDETAKAISTFRDSWTLIQHEKATRTAVLENLPQHSIIHFSCHGSADFGTPLNSGLVMANDKILSLRDFLDLQLQSLRLVVLSACETGLPGTALPDEVVSLPTGLLQAGAAGVVSSLWSVNDLSTMVLLSRFYEFWRTENLDPPAALRQAQLWLRDSTGSELVPYLKDSNPALAQKLEQALDEHPFAHPFYWAAFTYAGV